MAFKHALDGDTAEAGRWEVACQIVRETAKAIQVNDGAREYWLPRSKVTITMLNSQGAAIVFLPEWLAKEKGII